MPTDGKAAWERDFIQLCSLQSGENSPDRKCVTFSSNLDDSWCFNCFHQKHSQSLSLLEDFFFCLNCRKLTSKSKHLDTHNCRQMLSHISRHWRQYRKYLPSCHLDICIRAWNFTVKCITTSSVMKWAHAPAFFQTSACGWTERCL